MPTKVFVGNLPDDCAQETIRDVFGSYGGIDEVAIVKNFAFVHFSNEGDANNAVRDLDGSKIGGKQINVEISKKQDGVRGRRDHRDRDRDFRGDRGPRRGRGGPERANNAGGILGAGPLGANPGLGPGPSIGGLPTAPLGGLGGPQLGAYASAQLGGLGGGPLGALGGAGAPLGGLGILSAVNTLAAVAEKTQQLTGQTQQGQLQFQERRTERDQPDPDVRVRREVVPTRDVPNAAAMGLTNGYVIYERYYVDPTHPLLKGLPLPELPRMTDNVANRETVRSDTRRDNFDGYRDRSPIHNGRRSDIDREYREVNEYRR